MRALLVHNPTAGTKGHDKNSIIDALHLADFKVDYVSTKEDGVKDASKNASAGTPAELAEQWRTGHVRPFNLIVVNGLKEEILCTEAEALPLMPHAGASRAQPDGRN